MNLLSPQFYRLRSQFLQTIRNFLLSKNFCEVDTPIYKKFVGMEPYLDPFQVQSPDGREKGYLITSPEYSLKMILSTGIGSIFEISHTFRSGEQGSPIHSAEFLMLELYAQGLDEKGLMDLIEAMLAHLDSEWQKFGWEKLPRTRITNRELFHLHTGRGWTREELLGTLQERNLPHNPQDRYEDLYYMVFLNCIEPNLPKGLVFLYDYPPECAALARIENGVGRRFEMYWDGVELANAFYELSDPVEQRVRLIEEQGLRQSLGKEVFPIDEDFLRCLEIGFPPTSGVSIGLDRLLARALGKTHLREVSPYFGSMSQS